MEFEGIRNNSINKNSFIKKVEQTNEIEHIKYNKLKEDGRKKKKKDSETSQKSKEEEDLFDDDTGKILDIKL